MTKTLLRSESHRLAQWHAAPCPWVKHSTAQQLSWERGRNNGLFKKEATISGVPRFRPTDGGYSNKQSASLLHHGPPQVIWLVRRQKRQLTVTERLLVAFLSVAFLSVHKLPFCQLKRQPWKYTFLPCNRVALAMPQWTSWSPFGCNSEDCFMICLCWHQ